MIVVLVETAQRHGPLGSLQGTLHVVVFPAAVRLAEPNRCTPTVVSWCEIDAASAAARSAERPESDRYRESGEADPSRHACGSPPKDRTVLPGVTSAAHPVADRTTRPGDE